MSESGRSDPPPLTDADLDSIERHNHPEREDVAALVAEVRRLRGEYERFDEQWIIVDGENQTGPVGPFFSEVEAHIEYQRNQPRGQKYLRAPTVVRLLRPAFNRFIYAAASSEAPAKESRMPTMEDEFKKLREELRNLGRALRAELPSLIVFVVIVWALMAAAFVAFRLL